MPVMYRKDIGRQWLEDAPSDDLELQLRTQPVLSEELEAYEISTLVNSPDNDSPECVRRIPPKVNQQTPITYFHRK
jgi:putative SOS response-associated peptidase YedK